MMTIITVALAPAIALLIFIYQKDRYDREPPQLLFKNFYLGVFSTVPVYFVEKFLMSREHSSNPLYQAFVVAGFTEELFKYIIVRNVSYKSSYYDEKLDGIVYSVFVSLGFASAENLLYVLSSSSNFLYTGIARAISAVPAHMLFAISMGYYLSLAKFSRNRISSMFYSIESLFVPIILHGIYDYILISKIYGYIPLFIIFVIALWKINLKKLNKYADDSRRSHS